MKTLIIVSGKPAGNQTLRNAIIAEGSAAKIIEVFNDTVIRYKTTQQARIALQYAYKKLVEAEPHLKNELTGIRKGKDWLAYDASKASISIDYSK